MAAIHAKPDQHRFALLDLLRLFTALMVVAFHWLFRGHASGQQLTAFPAAESLAVYGYIGVDWFFVLSGFVIAWTAEGRTAMNFAILRFARLYPGYMACMTITFLMTVSYSWPQFSPGWADWLANATMAAPVLGHPFMDGAYWSIVVEIVFYGWVFLGLATGMWNRRIPVSAIWLALSFANMLVFKSEALRFLLITDFAPWFIIGLLMQDMWKRGACLETSVLVAAAFFASCLSLALAVPGFARDYGAAPDLALLFSLNLLGILLIAAAVNAPAISHRLARVCTFAGAVSYPLYLFHQHAGYMLIDRFAPMAGNSAAAVVALTATLAVAISTAILIEKPLRPVIIKVLTRILHAVHLRQWEPKAGETGGSSR